MLRKTYIIQSPSYLHFELKNLIIETKDGQSHSRSLDDADSIIVDHNQVSFSVPLLQALVQNQIDLVICDPKHIPCGIYLPLNGHTLMGYRSRIQAGVSKPLKKNIWKLTIQSKIRNQAFALESLDLPAAYLHRLFNKVKSGDINNIEAMGAAYYWKKYFALIYENDIEITRNADGLPPNNLLNFGYAILRSMCARYLIAAGLWPLFGIHHQNMYNSFPLADDIMEPYRPIIDTLVLKIYQEFPKAEIITHEIKAKLLTIHTVDVLQDGCRRPFQVALQNTCSSLAKVFETKNLNDLKYPTLIP